MDRIRPIHMPLGPDGRSMSGDELRELHDKIAEFDQMEWIDEGNRAIVERYMPDLADRLPARPMEKFEQAFGRMRAAAKRKATADARRAHRDNPRGERAKDLRPTMPNLHGEDL